MQFADLSLGKNQLKSIKIDRTVLLYFHIKMKTLISSPVINWSRGGLSNKGRFGCVGPGVRSWEVNFAQAFGFGHFLTKNV